MDSISVGVALRPCLVHPKIKKLSRFPVTSNLVVMHEALNIEENKN